MAEEITLKTVLDHLHAMEERLSRRFDLVDVHQAGLKTQLTQTEAKLSWQIDTVDKRLVDIGRARLPEQGRKPDEAVTNA